MAEEDSPTSRLRYEGLIEVLAVSKLLRGPILASIAAAVVLAVPDQIQELYRIYAADRDWGNIASAVVALLIMSICFWWVSFRVAHGIPNTVRPQRPAGRILVALLPGIVGALPLAAGGQGLLSALPRQRTLQSDLTSAWAGMAEEFSAQVVTSLNIGACVMFLLALIVFALALWTERQVAKPPTPVDSDATPAVLVLFGIPGIAASLAVVIGLTVTVHLFPVTVPVALGTLPLVALFFIAIMLMVGQMTLWHERTGIPFFILLTVLAVASSAFDWNDNHEIAAVTDPAKALPLEEHHKPVGDAWDNFLNWYKARPNRSQFKETYPVYIVAAQGGGIYAAYHAATLLSRLQDRCPEFSNHLFAISSVSGGSVGSAVFSSVVKARAAKASTTATAPEHAEADTALETSTETAVATETVPATNTASAVPCPSMERAGFRRFPSNAAGPHEQAASKMLSEDFLSPLVAATLFPDFTQRFLPFAVPSFDRARALERAFARAWERTGLSGSNPFEESVLKAWSPDGQSPALLINMTEADSGRRSVIAPFAVGDNNQVLNFPTRQYWTDKPRQLCMGREVSLSTAVGLSARFPWLTPAGSLSVECRATGRTAKVRLVDGGYFDNSGVETALDVIDRIEATLAQNDGRPEGTEGPRVELHLIVLNTSEFPKRGYYGLGEALEPIRTMLSSRTARTPITVERATKRLGQPAPGSFPPGPRFNRIHEARFHNPIYEMPLGWVISKGSRKIIDIQNGRFWDCSPDPSNLTMYRQGTLDDFSNADCIQMMVYHQLNETVDEELALLYRAEKWRREDRARRETEKTLPQRISHNAFMRCYNDALRTASRGTALETAATDDAETVQSQRGLQRRQRDALEQILLLWDRNPQFTDDRWLSFILALADYESGAVLTREGGCLTEKCTLRTLERMRRRSPIYAKVLEPDARGNRYYGRGFVQMSFAQNYKKLAEATGEPIYEQPDLLLVPEVSARVLFAWLTVPGMSPQTLDRVTSADGFDIARAFKAHAGGLKGLEAVKRSDQLFSTCIASAKIAQ
jgi:hypothetical protein